MNSYSFSIEAEYNKRINRPYDTVQGNGNKEDSKTLSLMTQ